jgi:hypothetical protein
MAYSVFISYSHNDGEIAEAICAALEAADVTCWIAPRDITPGKEWAAAIVEATNETSLLVLVLTANSNNSPQVRREVSRVADRGKSIVVFWVEDVKLSTSLEYYIDAHHWLDALKPPLDKHIQTLVTTVKELLAQEAADRARREAEEAAQKKAKQEAEEARRRAEREAKESQKAQAAALRAQKEAEEAAKEQERKEAEAAREMAKRELEEARKAQEEARKAKAEAEASRQRAEQEAEEARKAREAALKAKKEAEAAALRQAKHEAKARQRAKREAEETKQAREAATKSRRDVKGGAGRPAKPEVPSRPGEREAGEAAAAGKPSLPGKPRARPRWLWGAIGGGSLVCVAAAITIPMLLMGPDETLEPPETPIVEEPEPTPSPETPGETVTELPQETESELPPISGVEIAEYFDVDYDLTDFDKSDISGSEVFYTTVNGEVACSKDVLFSNLELSITYQVVAEHATTTATVILNPDYTIDIEEFPTKKGEKVDINRTVPLQFPVDAESGDYTVTAEVIEAKVNLGYWLDMTPYLQYSQVLGDLHYTAVDLEET